MDGDIYDEPDASRPFFQRKKREVGIYMDVYDATPVEKRVGLEHFFLMKTNELLYQEFKQMDLVNIRAAFDMSGMLKDCYLERFEPGIVMAVACDTEEAVKGIWQCHRDGKLAPLLHEVLITPEVLGVVGATRVELEVRLWDDEYHECLTEIHLTESNEEIEDIRFREKDMAMVRRLKQYQVSLGQQVLTMRDLEFQMDELRSDFMNCIRRIIPEGDEVAIGSLRHFEELSQSSLGMKLYNRAPLDLYQKVIDHWRDRFEEYEIEIVTPLLQIHKNCETDQQKETKRKIIGSIKYMQQVLDKEAPLKQVFHPEAARKVLKREAGLFLGLLSLLPLGAEKVADVDILIDDYMRKYNFEDTEFA